MLWEAIRDSSKPSTRIASENGDNLRVTLLSHETSLLRLMKKENNYNNNITFKCHTSDKHNVILFTLGITQILKCHLNK